MHRQAFGPGPFSRIYCVDGQEARRVIQRIASHIAAEEKEILQNSRSGIPARQHLHGRLLRFSLVSLVHVKLKRDGIVAAYVLGSQREENRRRRHSAVAASQRADSFASIFRKS